MTSLDISRLAVGSPVGYLNGHGLSRNDTCTFTTVARFTATQVILSDGKRFHRSNGRMVGNYDGELVAADGPEATHARILAIHRRAASAIYELQRWHTTGNAHALDRWLDQVSDVVTEARSTLVEVVAAAKAGGAR